LRAFAFTGAALICDLIDVSPPGCCCENVHRALEVVCDGGEVDLGGGFGETSPSHSTQAVASPPGSENLLDPAMHAVDQLVPLVELAQSFLLIAAPHASRNDPGDTSLRPDGIADVRTAIGAIGPHLEDCRASFRPALPSLMLAEDTKISSTSAVSASAPTWALKPWTARFLVLHSACIRVTLETGRRRIDQF
jgi:hypothetical protein